MKFPLSIKKTITLDRRVYGISSEGYLLNIISDYMKQFKMAEDRGEEHLHYRKKDLIRAFRAKDAIRNVVIWVKIEENDIRITVEMQTLFELLIIILPLIGILLLTDLSNVEELFIFIATVLFCGVFVFLTRYTILLKLVKEIRFLTSKLKRT